MVIVLIFDVTCDKFSKEQYGHRFKVVVLPNVASMFMKSVTAGTLRIH
jgi:hypothetical protein